MQQGGEDGAAQGCAVIGVEDLKERLRVVGAVGEGEILGGLGAAGDGDGGIAEGDGGQTRCANRRSIRSERRGHNRQRLHHRRGQTPRDFGAKRFQKQIGR